MKILRSSTVPVTIDIDTYYENKTFVVNWFNTKGGKDINRSISMMASITFVPAIVVAYWIGEATSWHPDSIAAITRLKDFYGYTMIQNKPQNAPI
jgi:hypothetical protein